MQTPPAIRIDNLVKEYASPGPGEPPKLALKGDVLLIATYLYKVSLALP